MKNNNLHRIFWVAILTLSFAASIDAQTFSSGGGSSNYYRSTIGKDNNALGNYSFAGGRNSTSNGAQSFAFGFSASASGMVSTAIGYNTEASEIYSMALGTYLKASKPYSYVFGIGKSGTPLESPDEYTISFGVNSNKPTMILTKAKGNSFTGSVGIGNITTPQAKLHIVSDNDEDAGIILQPTNPNKNTSFIQFVDNTNAISVKTNDKMDFKANRFRFGNANGMKITLQSGFKDGGTALFSNAYCDGSIYRREDRGSSYAIEFNNDALRIRTAVNQIPRGTEITNWKDALFLTTNGKVGIGSTETFLMNKGDEQLLVVSPKKMVFQTGIFNVEARDITQIVSRDIFGYATDSIRLTGEKAVKINGGQINMESNLISMSNRVGINTQYVPEDFAMAVNGGIISTRVHIRDLDEWPDFVFANGYGLMPLNELKQYVDNNNHLPDVPSEAEVNENGIDLGEMQSILLKKIEELTLYTIKQQEEIEALRKELNELKAK